MTPIFAFARMLQDLVMLLSFVPAFFSAFIVRASGELQIRNSGIEHIDRLDVGMVFFVEIANEGKHPIALATRMIDCCETVTPEDVDCEHIQLIGGDMGVLNSRGVRNLTLVWPTLYLHERKGECNIAISYGCRNNETGEIRHKVRFDTSISGRSVPAVLEGYYEPMSVERCPSVDLDPIDHCRPINCHVKYNGRRNFYNRKLQRCQPVPICIADTGKELPDVAYVPVSNTCRDLENAVNEMEIRALSRGEAEPAWGSEPAPRMMNMYCHQGYNENVTGFCICNDGWTSQPLKNLEPSNEYIHMCNVQVTRFPRLPENPVEIVLFIIAGLLGTLVVVSCCAMAFMMRGFMPSGPKADRGQQTQGATCSDSSAKSFSTSCSSSKQNHKLDYRHSTS